MEKWQEIFAGKIPQDNYQTQILNGEKQGLIVELYGSHFCVIIKFGMIQQCECWMKELYKIIYILKMK